MNLNINNINLPRVVIIGSGFAGLRLARKIKSKYYQVVLIDKNNYHTFQPLMYQVASSGLEASSIVYPIRKAFKGKKNFHFRVAEVDNVDVDKKIINTNIGSLKYDYLVVATGAATNFFGMKNIEKYSYTMKSLVESLALRNVILENFEKALTTSDLIERKQFMTFAIVGGGATGIELAGALAELKNNILQHDYPDLDIRSMEIHVIEGSDRILPGMSDNASEKAYRFLNDIGIIVWLNTTVKDFDGSVVITDKAELHTNTLIWSAGVKGLPIKKLDKSINRNKRINTDDFHKVAEYADVYAVGDVSCIVSEQDGRGFAMLGSVAAQQGTHLGKNFNALARNKPLKPFKYQNRGTMATIGRHRAVVDLPFLKFSGIIAWYVWMFLHLMLLVGYRNMLVVLVDWGWRYFKYDNGLRLIIGNVKRQQNKEKSKVTENVDSE